MIGRTIAELAEGETAELTRTVGSDDVAAFVDAVGDYNPVHSDAAYAASTPFREPIAPGIYTAGLISAVIGTRLPGPGAIYLSQSLKFSRPVKFGDRITARVVVEEVLRERNRIRLRTACVNQAGEEVLSGEAWVMPSRVHIDYEERPAFAGAAVWAFPPWAFAAQALSLWGLLGCAVMAGALRPRS